MNVAVIGAGYVGLVSAAGLASIGHRVKVGEADAAKLEILNRAEPPFHENGLDAILQDSVEKGLLTFHHSNVEAVAEAAVVLLALPTPPAEDGSADLSAISHVLDGIAEALPHDAIVATKSTVPVGSVARFQAQLAALGSTAVVVSNPEFLREGSAVTDFFHPDRIVIGSLDQRASQVMVDLYKGIQAPVIVTDPASSEMIKYASNAYLATRITFANALANLCESVGADATAVLDGMGHDRRIGFHFLNPGPGYGGSCFPKDTSALVSIADDAGYDFSLLRGVIEVNELQHERVVDKVKRAAGEIGSARVALWGLAFKAGTDDTRESPAVKIGSALAGLGASVSAYDPVVRDFPSWVDAVAQDPIEAVEGADVLLIATEWPEFSSVDLKEVATAMSGSAIVDARNMVNPAIARQLGFSYEGIGR